MSDPDARILRLAREAEGYCELELYDENVWDIDGAEAIRRARKLARKKAQREGML